MNAQQIIYVAIVAALFLAKGPSFPLWVIAGNMAATIAACLAMDLGYLDRDGATLTMMVIDFVAGAILMAGDGFAMLLAAGYALNLAFYTANILFGVSANTTFALVIAIGFIQLAVIAIGKDGGNGSRVDRRYSDVGDLVLLPRRDKALRQGDMAQAQRNRQEHSG